MRLIKKLLKLAEVSYIDFIMYFLFSLLIFVFYWENNYLNYLGIFISIFGFYIWYLGRLHIKDSFDILPSAKKLVDKGIYSKLRHPIYYAGFLVLAGIDVFTIGKEINLYLILITILYLILQIIRIFFEEKALEKKFGKKYLEYRKSTLF